MSRDSSLLQNTSRHKSPSYLMHQPIFSLLISIYVPKRMDSYLYLKRHSAKRYNGRKWSEHKEFSRHQKKCIFGDVYGYEYKRGTGWKLNRRTGNNEVLVSTCSKNERLCRLSKQLAHWTLIGRRRLGRNSHMVVRRTALEEQKLLKRRKWLTKKNHAEYIRLGSPCACNMRLLSL
jgi:hypothetical protein